MYVNIATWMARKWERLSGYKEVPIGERILPMFIFIGEVLPVR